MKRLAVAGLLLLLCACASQPAPPRVALPTPPPSGGPVDLIGLSGAQLKTLFGTPVFSRKENGSEMWRYDTKSCRVFFFLYSAGADVSVRHVETLPRGKDVAADPGCINVLRGKPASPVS